MGPGLAAVADDRVNAPPGRRQEGDHPVIIPIVDVPKYDGCVFCLNHGLSSGPARIPPACSTKGSQADPAHGDTSVIYDLAKNQRYAIISINRLQGRDFFFEGERIYPRIQAE